MADHATPHFHNQMGLASIKVSVREFMCIGALPPFDHPHIFIDMGSDTDAICPYCSTRFVYEAGTQGPLRPCRLRNRESGRLIGPCRGKRQPEASELM